MASFLNRGQIISQGLEEGGNTGITSLAETFLNSFLDQLARAIDHPDLLEEESVTLTSTSYIDTTALTATYLKIRGIHLDGEAQELTEHPGGLVEIRKLIRRDSSSSNTGKPQYFFSDPAKSRIWVWPTPDKSYPAVIWFYKQPAALTSDSDIPWVDDASLCIAAVAEFAARYDRDNMYVVVRDLVDRYAQRFRAGETDYGRQRSFQLRFDPATHHWRRRDQVNGGDDWLE